MLEEYLYIRSSNNNPGFKNFIESLGGNPTALLRELYGEKMDAQEKLNFVPWSTVISLYENYSTELDEPAFGIKWAMAMPKDFRNAGPNVFFLSISNNLEQFAKLAIEFQRLHTNAVIYSYDVDNDKNEVTSLVNFHPMATYSRQFCEHIMAVMVLMGEQFLPGFQVKTVNFQHSRPKDVSLHQKLFKCPVNFDCSENSMVFDRKWLKLEKREFANKALKSVVKAFIDWRVRKNLKHKATIAMTLAELLPSLLGVKKSDIETIASAMNMSPKKLQRLLQDEGTSYSAVLDTVRQKLAARLLIESNMTILHIAHLLDYRNDKTFIAAFKRWFDMPPGQYRKRMRE